METHQKLTYAGVVFLIITFVINYYHEETHPDVGFNYAYVPGIAMLALFLVSFIIFTKDKLKG